MLFIQLCGGRGSIGIATDESMMISVNTRVGNFRKSFGSMLNGLLSNNVFMINSLWMKVVLHIMGPNFLNIPVF